MNTVLTQNDINDIVKAIADNANVSEQVISATAQNIANIAKIADKNKNLEKSANSIVSLDKFVNKYTAILKNLIGTLCKDLPGEGKQLSELMGRIKEKDQTTGEEVVKWTVLEATQQIPKILDSTFKTLDSVGNFKMGFFAVMKLKLNIIKLKFVLKDVFKTFLSVFGDIATDSNMDLILKTLIKQPDIVNKHIENGYDSETKNTFIKSQTDNSTQGALGFIDIVDRALSIISSLNNIKFPSFVRFFVNLKRFRFRLKFAINQIFEMFLSLNENDKLSKELPKISAIIAGGSINGENNEKSEYIGIYKIVMNLKSMLDNILEMNITKRKDKKLDETFNSFDKLLKRVVDLVNSPNISILSGTEISKNIKTATTNINSIVEIASTIQSAAKGLLFIKYSKKILVKAFGVIDDILAVVAQIAKRENTETQAIDNLLDIVNNLVKISYKVILLGTVSIAACIALIPARWFILGLRKLLLKPILLLTKNLRYTAKESTKGYKDFTIIIGLLLLMGTAIIGLAVMSNVFIQVITWNILPFLGAIVLFAGFLWVVSLGLEWMAKKTIPNLLKFSGALLLTAAILLGAGATLLLISYMAEKITMEDAFKKIGGMILGIVGLIVVLAGLGYLISMASVVLVPALLGFGAIFAMFGMLLGIGSAINTIASFDLQIGDEKTPKTAKYNLTQIFDFIDFIRKLLGGDSNGRLKRNRQWRRDKKMLKQVDKSVKEIVDIANRLNTLQNININIEKLIGKTTKDKDGNVIVTQGSVGKIFDCVNKINEALTLFNKESGDGATYRRDQIKTKRRMRRNKKILSKVDKVINKIADITESLLSIKEFTLTPEEETAILGSGGSIEKIFECINKVDEKIRAFNSLNVNANGETYGIFDRLREIRAARKQKREYKHNAKSMSKVESIMLSLGGMVDALNSIKEFTFEKETISTKVETLMSAIETINSKITGSNKLPNNNEISKLTSIADYMFNLGEGAKGLAEADSTKLSKNIGSYSEFISKINTVEVTKLENATNMFKQMASFSTSIKGDFKDLATSLSDKLLPVLEELKEVMSKVPEKIDQSSQNISASVNAANSPVNRRNVERQVKAENPELTKEEIKKEVDTRMTERAQADTNSVAAKLDELISLFKGYTGEYAVFQSI